MEAGIEILVDNENETASHKPLFKRGKRALRLLDDIANSDPQDWRLPSSDGGPNKGLVFAQTGRLLCDIGDASLNEDEDAVKVYLTFYENWYSMIC